MLPAVAPPVVSPATLDFGQHHVGDTVDQALTVTNPNSLGSGVSLDVSDESLTYNVYTEGTIAALAPQASDTSSLLVGLYTGGAGTIAGPVQLTYDETGTTNTTGTETIDVAGTLFALATADLVDGTTLDLGITHVGTAETGDLLVANSAAAGTLAENLDAALAGAGSGLATGGTVSLLAAGASSSALGVTLSEGAAGSFAVAATLDPVSDGSGIDTLGTTALGPQVITVKGTFSNYATADFAKMAGAGTLSGGGTSWALNLGTLLLGGAAAGDTLGVQNVATGLADSLDAAFVLGATGAFTDSGFAGFTTEPAGILRTVGTIGINPTAAGTYTETVTLLPASDLDGSLTTLAAETLTVTAVVAPLVPPTIAPNPVSFGDVRLNALVQQGLTVTNAATAGSGETLDLTIAKAASDVTASGSIAGLAPGQSSAGALTVGIDTSNDGKESGGAVVTYALAGAAGVTGAETVAVSGTVFAPATADVLSGATLDLGVQHVGTTLTGALQIENAGSADGFTEQLDASLSGLGNGLIGSGGVSLVARGGHRGVRPEPDREQGGNDRADRNADADLGRVGRGHAGHARPAQPDDRGRGHVHQLCHGGLHQRRRRGQAERRGHGLDARFRHAAISARWCPAWR